MSNQVWANPEYKLYSTLGENLWYVNTATIGTGTIVSPTTATLAFTSDVVGDTTNFTVSGSTITINKPGLYCCNIQVPLRTAAINVTTSSALLALVSRSISAVSYSISGMGGSGASGNVGDIAQQLLSCSFTHVFTPGDTLTFQCINYCNSALTIPATSGRLCFEKVW